MKFNSLSLPALIDYIINMQHAYLLYMLSQFDKEFKTFEKDAAHDYEEFAQIKNCFFSFCKDFENYLKREAHIVFPYLKALQEMETKGEFHYNPEEILRHNPASDMESKHLKFIAEIAKLQNKLLSFNVKNNSTTKPVQFLSDFADFEKDIDNYFYMEVKFLLPKVHQLEDTIRKKKHSYKVIDIYGGMQNFKESQLPNVE